ncbi:MAG: acyl-[ACP]--phospholipid O-acyltransferase [Verrucomicrobiae bacterium]|nr:acyl-[ACP]--phospholipid O-acyltransferase [Verrucomicrobiae bacterium]
MKEQDGWQRGFWSLWATQFQGAFSDNVHKALVTFLVGHVVASQAHRDPLASLIGMLFAVPFILFSMAGGWLADRFSKRDVTIGVKLLEVAVMALATVGFATANIPLLLVCVFLMSTQSALFGPSEYGLMPELLPEKRLSWGNGLLVLGTNVAIVTGVAVAGPISDHFSGQRAYAGLVLVALAVIGIATSLGIPKVPAARTGRRFRLNFIADWLEQWELVRRDRVLRLAVVGEAYFSFLGSLLLLNVFIYGKDIFRASDSQISFLQAAIAIGVGVGSFSAGYLSGGKIEYGLVPLGAFGITVVSALAGREGLSVTDMGVHLGMLGFAAGFFIVPLAALIQHRPDREIKGAVIGTTNTLSFTGVLLGSAAFYVLRLAGLDAREIFLAGAVMTAAGTVYIVRLLPDAPLRLLIWLLTHSIYRIKVEGRDNIPEKGGALFVCNHVSFVDALLLIGSTDRMLHAVIFKDIYDLWFVKPFARAMKAIPISAQVPPREMILALREANEAIRAGDVVLIFADRQLTRTGLSLPFRQGLERVMKGVNAPIIPVCLDNVWGSIFSFEQRRFVWKVPRYFPYPVTVWYGKPLPPTATASEVRQALQDLNADAWRPRRQLLWPLHRSFVRKAQYHRWRFFMADASKRRLNFGAALTNVVFLARRLRVPWRNQQMVGVLLPPCVPAALLNYAALLAGKVPVNLNYTLGQEALACCVRRCNLKSIVTSRQFLQKIKISSLGGPGETPVLLFLEEIAAKPSFGEKLAAVAMSWLLPPRVLERALSGRNATLDDLAAVIFTSGSTGEPKGVMLSHWNIRSNIEQIGQTFAFHRRDRIMGVLPFFDSFGFTVTLMMPAVLGCGVVFHPSPLDGRAVGVLVRKYRCTFLLVTPTFLQVYFRACRPEDLGSLQYVVTGAEKLTERLAQAFEEKFGIRPLEVYGCTECSPVVAVNTLDLRAAGFRQTAAKRSRIGYPLPGVAVRIVDPETRRPVAVGLPGLLLVRGPNVMMGYVGEPERTAGVLRDGWYDTGDVASLDEDGFLAITDRLGRLSKIGGDLLPHSEVEEELHKLAETSEPCFAVTAAYDEKESEQLAVLHTLSEEKLAQVLGKLAECDLPNLWKPEPANFIRVEALPVLGNGKLDLRTIKKLAQQKLRGG